MRAGRHAQPRRPTRAAPNPRRGRHRRPSRAPHGVVALVAVPVVVASGSAAYAFWSAQGSGTATVGTTTAAPLTVGSSATPLTNLYPGRQVDLGFTVANPNVYPVSLTRLTALTVTSSDEGACPAGTHLTLTSAVTTGVSGGGYVLPTPISVPAGSSAPGSLAGLITMKTTAPDGCQGRTFTVSMTFTGSQV